MKTSVKKYRKFRNCQLPLEIPWDPFTRWLHEAALSGTLAETLRSLREADDVEFCMGGKSRLKMVGSWNVLKLRVFCFWGVEFSSMVMFCA